MSASSGAEPSEGVSWPPPPAGPNTWRDPSTPLLPPPPPPAHTLPPSYARPAYGPPGFGPPPPGPVGRPPGPPERSNTGLTVVAIVAVAALVGAVAWFSLGTSKDGSSTDVSSISSSDDAGGGLRGGLDPGATGASAPSATPPTERIACNDVDPSAFHPSATNDDLVAMTRQGLAPRPFDGRPTGPAAQSVDYPTPTAFLDQSNVPDPEARKQVMVDGGYRDGIESRFAAEKPFDVTVLAFRDAAATAEYLRARLPRICALRGTEAMMPLGDDGFAFVDGVGSIQADFILGGHQVSLLICGCAEVDGLKAMYEWYLAWLEHYGAGSTS